MRLSFLLCVSLVACGGADAFVSSDAGDSGTNADGGGPPMCPPGTNFMSDPNNCGGCGVVCTGGTCAGGVCSLLGGVTPPKVGDFACLTIDANNVYWATGLAANNGGAVYKVPKNGGMPAAIAMNQQNPHGIASSGTSVFWTTLMGQIMKSDTSGGSVTPIVSGQPGPIWLTIDQSNVYWTNNDGSVWKAGQDGSNPTKLASLGQGHAGQLAVDATNVYFTDPPGAAIYQVPIAAPVTPVAIAKNQPNPRGLAVRGSTLYFGIGGSNPQGSTGSVSSLPLGNPAAMPTPLAKNQPNPQGVATDGSNVYWANGAMAGSIAKVATTGGNVATLAQNQLYPNCIAIDQTSVYWINEGGGAISKTGK